MLAHDTIRRCHRPAAPAAEVLLDRSSPLPRARPYGEIMTRRLLLAALLPLLVIASGACDSKAPEGKPTVAFVQAAVDLNFANEMADGFRYGVSAVGGVELFVSGPPIVDGPRQVAILDEMAKKADDGISVFTLAPELLARPMANAAKQGIPLIAVDNPPAPGSKVDLFVGNDNHELGQMLADEIIKQLPANATGMIVLGTSTPGARVLDNRVKGMRDRLTEKLPNVEVVGPFDTKQDVGANLESWQSLVRANPDALAFLGTGDADAYNLASIRKATGGRWLAGAFDLDPKSLLGIKDGNLVVASPEHFLKGAVAGWLQAKHAKDGKALPKGWVYTPGIVITRANVDEIIARQASMQTKNTWFASRVDAVINDISGHLRPMENAG
jgi:ribose transport system substrate-binding protein